MEIEQTLIVQGETVVLQTGKKDAYIAYVPAMPGCQSIGHTKREVLANIRQAISHYQAGPSQEWNQLIDSV